MTLFPSRAHFKTADRVFRSAAARALGAIVGLLVVLTLPRPAAANELDEFRQAQQLYEAQQYTDSALLFEQLVGGDLPRLQNRALLLESRKYLAVCYLFLSRRQEAEEQFELLLRDEASYQLDPLAFPEEVQTLFDAVRGRFQSERRKAAREREQKEREARKLEAEKLLYERENFRLLVNLAETERVKEVNSRWIALIPFGVGQFQNGHNSLGAFLAVSEALLAAINIASFFLHQSLEGQQPSPDRLGEARFAEKTFRITNQVSLGVLAMLSVSGVVDAQLRFRPHWTREQPRKIPDELKTNLRLSAGEGQLGLAGRF